MILTKLYLDYFSDRQGYNPSSTTLSSLYTSGLRKHPLAGFSRSIYHTLTGQKVPVTLTHLSGNSQIRSKDMENETFLYANPSYIGELTLNIPNYEAEYSHSCTIQSASGVAIHKEKLRQKVTALSLGFEAGMYFITVTYDDQIIEVHKWTKTE